MSEEDTLVEAPVAFPLPAGLVDLGTRAAAAGQIALTEGQRPMPRATSFSATS